MCDEPHRLLARPVVAVHLVPGVEQALGDAAAHRARDPRSRQSPWCHSVGPGRGRADGRRAALAGRISRTPVTRRLLALLALALRPRGRRGRGRAGADADRVRAEVPTARRLGRSRTARTRRPFCLRPRRAPEARRELVHIELFANGLVLLLPPGIGMAPPRRADGVYVPGPRCSYPVRTTTPTGVVEFVPAAHPTARGRVRRLGPAALRAPARRLPRAGLGRGEGVGRREALARRCSRDPASPPRPDRRRARRLRAAAHVLPLPRRGTLTGSEARAAVYDRGSIW